MTADIQEILACVESYSSERSRFGVFAESALERRMLLVLVVTSVAVPVLFLLPSLHVLALIAGFLFVVSMLSLVVAQAGEVFGVFRVSLSGYAEASLERLKARSVHIETLAEFKPEALREAVSLLERDLSRIQRRLFTMLGVIEKAGFIPVLVVLYFAGSKILAGQSDASLNLLTVMVFVFYGGAFLGHRYVELLSLNIACLREATDLSEKRLRLGQSG